MLACMGSAGFFQVLKKDANCAARIGRLSIPGHADIQTPAPLLYTQKGGGLSMTFDIVAKLPGFAGLGLDALHFTGWPKPELIKQHGGGARGFLGTPPEMPLIVTGRDSLAFEYTGVSNRDAGAHVKASFGNALVSPQQYVEIVAALKPDVYVALADEVAAPATEKRTAAAVRRTAKWLDTTIQQHAQQGFTAALFAPVVGGRYAAERRHSAQEAALRSEHIAGFALAGFATGETREECADMLAVCSRELPANKPRLLQGVFAPDAVLAAVSSGVDVFDSGYAHTATAARSALAFPTSETEQQKRVSLGETAAALDLRDAHYRLDKRPLLPGCTCFTCANHSRAYVHHLMRTKEMLGLVLLDIHNCHHMLCFFQAVRQAIQDDQLPQLRNLLLRHMPEGDSLPSETQVPAAAVFDEFATAPSAAA